MNFPLHSALAVSLNVIILYLNLIPFTMLFNFPFDFSLTYGLFRCVLSCFHKFGDFLYIFFLLLTSYVIPCHQRENSVLWLRKGVFCESPDSKYFKLCGPHPVSIVQVLFLLIVLQLSKNINPIHSSKAICGLSVILSCNYNLLPLL